MFKSVKNAAWIIGCRMIQAILGLVVTMMSARYLGPTGYGVINYAASIVAFFVPFMQLGLNATLVQEIVNDSEHEGQTMGTALGLTFLSSLACVVGVATFTMIANHGEVETIFICVLYSFLLVFQSIEMIQYWFQAKLLSKYTAVITLVAYILISAYRILLLTLGSSMYLYAISQAIDFGLIAFALLFVYKRISKQKLSFSFHRAKEMLIKSRYYIISGLMVTVFAQTDRVMLKLIVNEAAVGFYSAAVTCASLTSFVFVAIIDSARPSILAGKNISEKVFEERLQLLYSVVIFFAVAQSVVMTAFAPIIINILYGSAYSISISALRIIVWYTTFSYIGSVRNIWLLAESKQRYLLLINLFGALCNVILNILFIPLFGILGASVASLITQFFSNFVFGYFLTPIKRNNVLILKALNFKVLIQAAKQFKNSFE